MVKKWSDVAADPQYQALSDDDKDALKDRYFENVVKPAAPEDQIEPLRARFDTATGYGVRGRSTQAGPTAEDMKAAPGLASAAPKPEANSTTPRRGTMRAVQPFVAGETSDAQQSEPAPAGFSPIIEGAKGLRSGVIGLKQMGNALGLQSASSGAGNAMRRLELFDQIDRGEVRDAPAAAGGTYEKASPEQRARIRANAESALAQNQQAVDLGMQAFRQYQKEQAAQKGATDDFTDINSTAAFGNWLAKNGMAGMVSMAPLLVAAATTGGAGAAALGLGMGIGETVGRRADNTLGKLPPAQRFQSPDRFDDAIAAENRQVQGRLAETAGANIGVGAASGALDVAFGPVKGLVTGKFKKAIAEGAEKLTAKTLTKEVAKDVLEEAITGGAQEALQIAGDVQLGDRDKFATMQTAKDILNAAAAEGAGGLMGGAGRAAYQSAAGTYQRAREAGFHVDPPLNTDTPSTRRTKTIAIFENLGAEYGMNPEAVKRAATAAASMPAGDVGPFLSRMAAALQARQLVAKPIDAHAAETLTAGPIEDPKLATEREKQGADKPKTAADEAVSNIDRILNPTEDLTGLSEPGDGVKPQQESDLTTGDGMPYGTQASAQARATREGGGELVRVNGGWVVRTEPTISPTEGNSASTKDQQNEDQPPNERGQQARGAEGIAQGGEKGTAPGDRQDGQDDDGKPVQDAAAQGQEGLTKAADEPAQPDLRSPAAEPAGGAAGRGADAARSGGAVGRGSDDAGSIGAPAAGEPMAGGGKAEPVRADAKGADAVGPRVIANVGTTPNSAIPLELRANKDGTLTPWHDGHEVLDFESGTPVSIPASATNADALQAVKDSGAFGRRTKYFTTAPTTTQKPASPPAAPTPKSATSAAFLDRKRAEADAKSSPQAPSRSNDLGSIQSPEAGAGATQPTPVAPIMPAKPGAQPAANAETAAPRAEPAPQRAEPKQRKLTDKQAFGSDYAAFTGRTVARTIPVEGGGTATLKLDARKAMQALDARLKALDQLKACIGARK